MAEAQPAFGRGRRLLLPPACVLATALAASLVYRTAPRAVAEVAFPFFAAALLAGPSLVYPWMRARGATPGAAVAGALALPALWLAKECRATALVFGPWQGLYYAINPLAVGLFVGCGLQSSTAEVLIRRRRRGRWELASGAALFWYAVAAIAAIVAWLDGGNGGKTVHYAYIALYRRVFGGG